MATQKFQQAVGQFQPYAVEGDFASSNPRKSYISQGNALITDATAGCAVARFAWVTGDTATNAGSGAPHGFVHREQQAIITDWRGSAGMSIPPGCNLVLMTGGDYWMNVLTNASVGQAVFASNTTGDVRTGAAGATIAGYTEVPKAKVASAASANELAIISIWMD